MKIKKRVKFRKQQELKIKMVPHTDLQCWKDNPRFHTKDVISGLAELIKIHGVRSPLVVWERNMTVYKGNLTLKAHRLLKHTEVPVVFHNFKSESAAIAYAISDNVASEFAEYDDNILSRLLQADEYNLTPKKIGMSEKYFKERQLLWESDLDISSIKEEDAVNESVIKIRCPNEKKESILRHLKVRYGKMEDVKIA